MSDNSTNSPPKPKGAIIESKPLFASYEKANKKSEDNE